MGNGKTHQVARSQCVRYPVIDVQLTNFKWQYKKNHRCLKKKKKANPRKQ